MARHLNTVTAGEWEELMDALVAWLARTDVAGSIAHNYSLYDALDNERAKANGESKTRQGWYNVHKCDPAIQDRLRRGDTVGLVGDGVTYGWI